jgi:hypothetical protein
MSETFKKVVVAGKVHDWYSISDHGTLITHLRPTPPISTGKSLINKPAIYDPSYRKILKFSERKHPDGSVAGLYIKMCFPIEFFNNTYLENESYYKTSIDHPSFRKEVYCHQLVMWAHRPIDQFPPEKLKDIWHLIPEEARDWISQTIVINHITHDPSDNRPCVLEYTTPGDNTRKAKKFYGGDLANKQKKIKNKPESTTSLEQHFI